MELSVSQVAERLGVTQRRVYAMLDAGVLVGRRIGSQWVVDDAQLLKPRRVSRPLSQRIAWAAIVGPDNASWISKPEQSKLRARLARLWTSPEPDAVLVSWLADRAVARTMSAAASAALQDDPDLVPSGVSDPRAFVSGPGQEFYAQPGTLDRIMRRHLLVDDPKGDTVIREAPVHLDRPVPILLVAADLADRGEARLVARARQLLEQAMAS